MIDEARRKLILKLAATGECSVRAIAANLGVSRVTVMRLVASASPGDAFAGLEPPPLPCDRTGLLPERCPRCGALAYSYCYACQVRLLRLNEIPEPSEDRSGDPNQISVERLNIAHPTPEQEQQMNAIIAARKAEIPRDRGSAEYADWLRLNGLRVQGVAAAA